MSDTSLPLIMLIGYFGLILGIAVVFSKKMANLTDFFLAGRNLGAFAVGIAFASAWFGAGSTMGTLNGIHKSGLLGLWYIIVPSFLSCLVILLLIAKRVAKRVNEQLDSRGQQELSQPQAVEAQYGKLGRLLLSVVILISITNFVASQMVAAGTIFNGVFGLDLFWSTLIATAIVVSYSVIGGYFAVVVTDFAQIILVITSLVILAIFTTTHPHSNPYLLPEWNILASTPETPLLKNIALTASFVLAWSVAPEMWQRMSSTQESRQAGQAAGIGLGILCLLFTLVTLIGIYSTGVLGQSDRVLVDLALMLPHPALSALVLIGFIAAVTSTMDSSINVGSLTFTHDLYQGFIRPNASEKELLWVSRLGLGIIAIPAMTIALAFKDIIHVLWMAADVYASAMTVPLLGLLFIKNPKPISGILAISSGLVMVTISALSQYELIQLPSFLNWPEAPYSTLLGVLVSATSFGIGQVLPERDVIQSLSPELK